MRRGLFVIALVLTAACGSPCTAVYDAEASADAKAGMCTITKGAWSASQLSRCESKLSKCSEAEQRSLETYANCLRNMSTCTSAGMVSWQQQRLSCGTALSTLTLECTGVFH